MSGAFSRFDEIDELLKRALELAEGERESFVRSATADDHELRDAALRLLESTVEDEPLLDRGRALRELGVRAAALAEADSEASVGALAEGDRFGAYEVVGVLGSGGMGEVYRARDDRLGREVALKVLPRDLAEDEERLERLEREARLLATLNDSRINTIHELEETEHGKALVLELVEGPTLAERLDSAPLPLSVALETAGQIAAALEAAHGKGVLHRDLKPSNVKLSSEGRVKVLDFGLAKAVETKPQTRPIPEADPKTRRGLVLGTAPYMSPEQLRGESVDHRSDLWAFGCVLFEMLAGTRAFEGQSGADTAAAVLEREPDWSALPPKTPKRVLRLVRSCLQKRPDERLPDAQAARVEVETALEELDRSRWVAGRPALIIAAVAALLIVVAQPWSGRETSRSEPAGDVPSIAVLPFANVTAETEDDYLSDGLTESLINSLSRLPNVRVVPRGIVFGYKGLDGEPQAVADELGARYLLTGRVAERDGQLTVGAELVDALDTTQLWGQQFVGPDGDLIEVRDDVVARTLEALRLELTAEERQRALDPATENPEAYRLYLRTNYTLSTLSEEGLERSVEYARRAVELDPGFALAWVALSQAHMSRGFVGLEPWAEAGDMARAATRRALELDDLLPEAWVELGYVRHHLDWDWAGAERAFARALELDPLNGDGHQGRSEALLSLDRLDEAIAAAARAVELAPYNANSHHWRARCLMAARRWDEALEAARKTLEIEPAHLFAESTVHTTLMLTGEREAALAGYRQALVDAGIDPEESLGWASALAHAGREGEARRMIESFEADRGWLSEHPFEASVLVGALAALDENDRAFEIIDIMVEQRSIGLLWAHRKPRWDPLVEDPRFADLLAAMNLPVG